MYLSSPCKGVGLKFFYSPQIILLAACLAVSGVTFRVNAKELANLVDPSGWNVEEIFFENVTTVALLEVVNPGNVKPTFGKIEVLVGNSLTEAQVRDITSLLNRDVNPGATDALILAVFSPSASPGLRSRCSIYPVRGLDWDGSTHILKMWRDGKTSLAGINKVAVRNYIQRAIWRADLRNEQRQEQAFLEIIAFLRNPEEKSILEKVYLLSLLNVATLKKSVRQEALRLTAELERETEIAVRISLMQLIQRLINLPSGLNLDVLEQVSRQYANWWNADVIKAATLSERMQFCVLAYKLDEYVRTTIPLVRKHIKDLKNNNE